MIDTDDHTDDHIEVVKISDWKPVRARKERSCTHCGGKIMPGEVYFRQAWKIEGDMVVTTSHDPHGACGYSW